jgi:GntR family transcriptional repressor for pyruvate dehydrogenase complex
MTERKVRPFGPVSRQRVHEAIAVQLRDAILDGRFKAGEKLPPERELAEEFAVNRTSIREAIKILEGLRLVTVRQGNGATVQPLIEGSLELLGPMIFHTNRVDVDVVAELYEATMPLLLEMARLAIERHGPQEIARLRDLRDAIADESREREARFASTRELLVLLSDMTRNRVWQMLARRTRDLFASPAFQETRRRLRRDPGRIVPTIDACLAALDRGKPREALSAVLRIVADLGDTGLPSSTPRPIIAQSA